MKDGSKEVIDNKETSELMDELVACCQKSFDKIVDDYMDNFPANPPKEAFDILGDLIFIDGADALRKLLNKYTHGTRKHTVVSAIVRHYISDIFNRGRIV